MLIATTSKLFYQSFTHKLQINLRHDTTLPDACAKSLYNIDYFLRYQSLLAGLKELGFKKGQDFKTHGFNSHVAWGSIYFKNPQVLDYFQSQLTDHCLEKYTRPDSQAQVLVMQDDHKVEIRRNLLHNRFRYVMTVKCLCVETNSRTYAKRYDSEEIEQWLADTIYTRTNNKLDYLFGGYGAYRTVKFVHSDHAMLFKLTWGERLVNSRYIKLVSEC